MIYEDEEQKPSHVSYKEYKKKLESNPNEGMILFISAFFVMLLVFLGVVKQLSPDVDVSIADNTEYSTEEPEKGSVDERLRMIQMEDNSYNNSSDDVFSPELEERVTLPNKKHRTVGETEVVVLETQKPISRPEQARPTQAVQPAQPIQPVQPTQSAQPLSTAKVIVGYYATAAQAEVAKGIIQDAGLGIQPFVRSIGGAYTLQVGSFASREKAQSVANDLLRNNFPARVIIE